MKYSKVELWVTTGLFLLILFSRAYYGLSDYGYTIERSHFEADAIFNQLLPGLSVIVVTYCAFAVLNFYMIPKLWLQKKHLSAAFVTVVVLAVAGLCFMVAQTYQSSWIYDKYPGRSAANTTFFSRGFSMATLYLLIYGVYVLIREAVIYQYYTYQAKQDLSSRILREIILTFSVWLALLVLIVGINPPAFLRGIGSFYLVVLPFCFGIYFTNLYWLIPLYKKGVFQSAGIYMLCLMMVGITLGMLEIAMLMQFSPGLSVLGYFVFFWLPPFALTIALSWWVYTANAQTYKQLATLKTALGTSNANLQFLRSQINPHFLFNALNTLYGTALIEKAEKTGEVIQKLGDMMRFMLHENNQEVIPLNREIEYLHNYIDLQNLRIAVSENIKVEANIADKYNSLNIAPMLLIPFIENAYKHGISFKQPSWINISLQLTANTLLLDVHNSLHPQRENDPEREHPGVGLNNVKQRLALLYPNKHELIVRQTANEYFIHLTLNLA
jgi:two-component system LytT family sensor kinase